MRRKSSKIPTQILRKPQVEVVWMDPDADPASPGGTPTIEPVPSPDGDRAQSGIRLVARERDRMHPSGSGRQNPAE
jgi:hypothetical protein